MQEKMTMAADSSTKQSSSHGKRVKGRSLLRLTERHSRKMQRPISFCSAVDGNAMDAMDDGRPGGMASTKSNNGYWCRDA